MAKLQGKIDTLKADRLRDDALLKEKNASTDRIEARRNRLAATRSSGSRSRPTVFKSHRCWSSRSFWERLSACSWVSAWDSGPSWPTGVSALRSIFATSLVCRSSGTFPPIRTNEPPEVKPIAALDPILASHIRPHSAKAEAVRGIRTQLLFSTSGREHQVLQITSPNPGDGKSTLAANLAISLAKSDKRVVLVDRDFRKPHHPCASSRCRNAGTGARLGRRRSGRSRRGGAGMRNREPLPSALRSATGQSGRALTTPKFQEILDDLRANYDFVIIDTPPVLAVSDPAAVAPRADGVILVFRMTKDARPAAERARTT